MTEQEFYLQSEEMITSHYGEEYENYYNAIVPPVFMNSLNVFESIEDHISYNREERNSFIYGRVSNPTVRILEDKVGALEHGCGALAFASGMAAATTSVLAVCHAGGHVVCVRNAYGPLRNFLAGYCAEHMNMTTTFITGDTVEEFQEAVTEKTELIVLESPSSLVFSLQDIHAVAEIAHAHNARVYIDNTYSTPIFQKPLDLGADIVMHTTSKYIGGHSDVIGGMLAVKDEELLKKLWTQRELLGGIVGPMEAWLMIRGLRTLKVRMAEHQRVGMQVAEYLENHPKVRKVNYPGLPSHPQYELAKKQQSGTSSLLSFEIDGTSEQSVKLAESLKIFKIGVSWGGFESLVVLPMMTASEEDCRRMGATKGVIRIFCGLEGAEALIADLEQALAQI